MYRVLRNEKRGTCMLESTTYPTFGYFGGTLGYFEATPFYFKGTPRVLQVTLRVLQGTPRVLPLDIYYDLPNYIFEIFNLNVHYSMNHDS